MSTEEIKKIIVDWAIECDISPNDFEWCDWFYGLIEPSLRFITFSVKNTAILVEELNKLQSVTNARHINIIGNNNHLEILVCYEDI